MYPLLAAGATSLASNLFESLGGMMSRKSTAAAATDPGAGAPLAAAYKPTAQEQIAALRMQLLSSPELQTALNTADPTHGATLSISPEGLVTYTGTDGRATALTLSPATANMARQLGGMMSQANQTPAGTAMALTGANSVRSLNAFA